MKVGVAPLRPPCQMRNISPRRCSNQLRFLVFNSETADEPVSHETPHHVAFLGKLARRTAKFQLTEVEHVEGTWRKCFFPAPKNRYAASC